MSALAPVDAASCRAMAVECGRRATYLAKRRFGAEALRELDRARELCILALKFEQEEQVSARGLSNVSESPAGLTSSPAQPGTNHESEGPKSRPGDAAASLTQQSNSPRQERPSAQERSSDRSGGQFGDAPKPAHIPGTEVQP